MSSVLVLLLVVAGAAVLYWAYTTIAGDKSVKQTFEEMTVESAAKALKEEAKKDLDLNNDGKVNVEDVKEAGKKVKAATKKAATKVKAATKKTTKK